MSTLEKVHPLTERLERISHLKESNLVFNPDVKSCDQLLKLVELCATKICMLKTHIDILEDFDPYVTQELRRLADLENFLIFEDRKFADIGTIVEMQYQGGIYQIADWAHLTNAHILPGPGIIEALKKVGAPKGNGLLLLAQMSSQGHLLNAEYTKRTIELAKQHSDFVVGFICQEKLCDGFIHLTPGVHIAQAGDKLGQQYNTPEVVIGDKKCDYIIVGRGIFQAADPYLAAEEYRRRGWQARRP